jgi:hypothetical protein
MEKEMQGNKLRELKNVRQMPGEGFRRWFGSDCFDLWVWYSQDRISLTGFQLVWDDSALAITWTTDHGFSDRRITPEGFGMKMTTLLDGEAGKVSPLLISIFKHHAEDIAKDLVSLIVEKIMEGAAITQNMIDTAEKEHPDLPMYLIWA